jgi:hypothetical protein
MAGLQDILTATADQIRDALTNTVQVDVQVEPRWIIAPTPLAVDVIPGTPGRDPQTAGFGDITGGYFLTVRARINTPDYDSSYDILMDMMDDESDLSLAGAVDADPTLGGTATSIDLTDFTGLQAYERIDGSGADLGFQFTVLALPA